MEIQYIAMTYNNIVNATASWALMAFFYKQSNVYIYLNNTDLSWFN